jgi:hypothetical protein
MILYNRSHVLVPNVLSGRKLVTLFPFSGINGIGKEYALIAAFPRSSVRKKTSHPIQIINSSNCHHRILQTK